jgi:transcriptional regulator with XRE-family HTH domain
LLLKTVSAITWYSKYFMQQDPVIRISAQFPPYIPGMPAGRPATKSAPVFGQRMAALRKERGWTQSQLAQHLGVAVKTVIYYEREAENPTRKTIERIAKVFGVAPVELMGQTNGAKNGHKPGPPSRLQQLSERLAALPRSKQKVVVQMLEGFLQQAGR